MSDDIQSIAKDYILQEFLPGEDPAELTETTPLVTGGVLDSIATIKLVMFLEERFEIKLEAHEADAENLDTLESIARLVRAKQG